MDQITFQPVSQQNTNPTNQQDFNSLVNWAKQNPQQFEDYVKQTNPQAYNRALQIRSSTNPQAIIMQMVQSGGINPNVLRMLGL